MDHSNPKVTSLLFRLNAALIDGDGEELLSLLDDALLQQPDVIRHIPHERYRQKALLLRPNGTEEALGYARERLAANPDDIKVLLSTGATLATTSGGSREIAAFSLELLTRAEELMRATNAAMTLDASDMIRNDLYFIMDHLLLGQVDEAVARARSAFSMAETETISAAVDRGWLPQIRKLMAPYADRL
jgi:hypothetical protein